MQENLIKSFKERFSAIEKEVAKVVIGHDETIRNILIGIIAGGNVLLEGAPGLGKTFMVKTFSQVLDLPFARIQFTPDLMPVDIMGTVMINKNEENLGFTFQKGPIFNSLILADEINRATPKTQSALLEAMQEKTVTVGTTTYSLPEPFFVLATENPIEMEGTYPLPEAQLDRFMFKLKIFLPGIEELSRVMDLTTGSYQARVEKLSAGKEILEMNRIAREVLIAEAVKQYALKIMMATHPEGSELKIVKDYVNCGASPRGAQSILIGAKIRALAEGRYNVSYQDIEEIAAISLRHRIFLNFRSNADRVDADQIIREILKKVK